MELTLYRNKLTPTSSSRCIRVSQYCNGWLSCFFARIFDSFSCSSSSSEGPARPDAREISRISWIEVLAVRPPHSSEVHVLVVDRVPDGESDLGGPGQAVAVRVELKGPGRGHAVTLRVVDARTPLDTGPLETPLARGAPVTFQLAGYGAAFLAFVGND